MDMPARRSVPLKNLWEYLKMSDEIIRELWHIKDSIAAEHGHDIEALVSYLQTMKRPHGQHVVDPRTGRSSVQPDVSAHTEEPRR